MPLSLEQIGQVVLSLPVVFLRLRSLNRNDGLGFIVLVFVVPLVLFCPSVLWDRTVVLIEIYMKKRKKKKSEEENLGFSFI